MVRLRPISDVSKMINMDPEWRGRDLVKGVGTTNEPIWPGTPSKFSHAQSQGSRASLLYLLWEFLSLLAQEGCVRVLIAIWGWRRKVSEIHDPEKVNRWPAMLCHVAVDES